MAMAETRSRAPSDPIAASTHVSEPEFVLGVDLDGVCVDYYAKMREIAADWLGVELQQLTSEVSYGFPEWNLDSMGGYTPLHRYAVTERRLFAEAPPIRDAGPALRRLSTHEDLRIRIITNRLFISYFHEEAVKQTIEWLDRHAIPYRDLCLLADKAAVGADLYVDDTPDNVAALRRKGLDTVVFTNSTNLGVEPPRADSWHELEELILERLQKWRSSGDRQRPAGH